MRLLRGLHGLQGEPFDTRPGQLLHMGGELGVPLGAEVEGQRAFEGHLAAVDVGDADGPFVGDVGQELRLVVPVVRLGAGAAARHVLQEGVAGVVGEPEQHQPARPQLGGVRHGHRPRALPGRFDGRQLPPFVTLVAGPALEGPGLRPDRGDQGVPTRRRGKPDEAAGPGPGRLVAAVAGAVDADQFGQVPRRVELRTAAAGAAQDDPGVADADHVVDAEGAGRDEHRATAGPAGSSDGTVDRGGGVGHAVPDGAVAADVEDEGAPGVASGARSADVRDLRVGVGGAGELPPEEGDLGGGGRSCRAGRRAQRHGCRGAEQGSSGEAGIAHVRTPFHATLHGCERRSDLRQP